MPSPNQDLFSYERSLRALRDTLSNEALGQFIKWKSLYHACESDATKNDRVSDAVKDLLAFENHIRDAITQVFLAIPKPEELVQRWDGGKAKTMAFVHEQAITELASFISLQYQLLRENIKNMPTKNQQKNQQSTLGPSTLESDPFLEDSLF